jgi:hypothetical protein
MFKLIMFKDDSAMYLLDTLTEEEIAGPERIGAFLRALQDRGFDVDTDEIMLDLIDRIKAMGPRQPFVELTVNVLEPASLAA